MSFKEKMGQSIKAEYSGDRVKKRIMRRIITRIIGAVIALVIMAIVYFAFLSNM